MNKCFKKFQVKDFVFLAILSAAMTLCGGITMPLVAADSTVRTPQYGGSSDICALLRDRSDESQKARRADHNQSFSGAPLVFFSPVMFFNNFVAAIIAELLMLLFFRGYNKKGSVLFTAGIYMPLSLPISVLFSIWLNGQS